MELLEAARRLDQYLSIDTTRLPYYDLTSPTETPVEVEANAQLVEDSIPAGQETATQAADQQQIQLRYWPEGTVVESEPPDTDSIPSTLKYPPSPKPSRMAAFAAEVDPNPLKRAHVGSKPGEVDVELEDAAAQLASEDTDGEGSELEMTKEEIRAAKIRAKEFKKEKLILDRGQEANLVKHLVPIEISVTSVKTSVEQNTREIKGLHTSMVGMEKKVEQVDQKVDGAITRITALEQRRISSPPSSIGGSSGRGDFEPSFMLAKFRPFNTEGKCPTVAGAKKLLEKAISACGKEAECLDLKAVEYLCLFDKAKPDQCHTAKLYVRQGFRTSQYLVCKVQASIEVDQVGAKVSLEIDPGESAIYNKLYEARDAIISTSSELGPKCRVDRRLLAVKIVDTNVSTVIAKLVDGRVQWLPSLWRLDVTLTKAFHA